MIYGRTKALSSYKGITKNFDAAIDYPQKNDAAKLPGAEDGPFADERAVGFYREKSKIHKSILLKVLV
jgi:hypothetical protein